MSSASRSQAADPPAARRAWRILISAVILALGAGAVTLVVLLPGCEPDPQPRKVPPVNVEVLRIRPLRQMDETFLLHGQVEANRVVDVSAEVPGRIEKIHLAEGRPCKEGKPLIQLNTDILGAEMRRTKATAEFNQRELGRLLELQTKGVATTVEVDQARAQAEAAKASFDLAQANLDRAAIVVPIDGVLNRVPVEVGEYVSPGDKVAQIVEIDTVKVVVDVPERLIHHVRLGEPHPILLDLRGNRERTGTVAYIAELADLKTRTTRVELAVPNPKKALPGGGRAREFRSGQIVKVRLKLRTHANAILIPLLAVIPLEEGKVVYVVNGDLAKRREVELGLIKGEGVIRDYRVQITKGLTAGDRLIVKGHQLVGPDQKVRVIRETVSPGPDAPATRRAATGPASAPARTPPHGTTRPSSREEREARQAP